MRTSGLLLLFFGLICFSHAQDFAPYTDEQSATVTTLVQNFVLPAGIEEDSIDPWMKWETVENFTFGKNRGSLSMITDLNALHPVLRDKVNELLEICRSKGIELAVVETYRTRAKQNEYRSLGKIYTRTSGGHSRHQYGLAIDVVPIVDSVAQWHNEPLWRKIGAVGEKLGLRWGGRWRHPYDPGHFEWLGGITSSALSAGAQPRLPKDKEYPCLQEDIELLKFYWNKWEEEQASSLKARNFRK